MAVIVAKMNWHWKQHC